MLTQSVQAASSLLRSEKDAIKRSFEPVLRCRTIVKCPVTQREDPSFKEKFMEIFFLVLMAMPEDSQFWRFIDSQEEFQPRHPYLIGI
ncbi:hypothetical protein CEXT_221781 [Caerostris extrusa]|uniref:Uncharacterized protein n=1 Tax=Caerostris extrusa TaxID=172846 RepID=A0AAV4M9U6_CAEEX|nr:hypothetical protein CEXT_221781 [Caerostris extrusa]